MMSRALEVDTQFEVDCRDLLLKKLEPVKKRLQTVVSTEKTAQGARKAQLLGDYKTVEEAHEAFGYGDITEDEYREIADGVSAPVISVNSAALDLLVDFIAHLKREVKDIQWAALPQAERDRIQQSKEQYRADLQARKAAFQ